MTEGYWILLLVLSISLIAQNNLLIAASLVLLLLKLGNLQPVLRWLIDSGIPFGLFLLILAVLAPVAAEKLSIQRFRNELFSLSGLIAIVMSAIGTYFAAYGVRLLQETPQVLVGLVVGSVVGVMAFGGVPTGPLIAAGLTAIILQWLR